MTAAAAGGYPVQFSVDRPARYQRVQILLRIGVGIVLGFILNAAFGFFYFVGPVISAVLIAQRGGEAFQQRYGAFYRKLLSFCKGLSAYLLFACDSFPSWGEEGPARLQIRTTGTPTVGSALLRLLLAIPHFLILGLLGGVAMLLGFVALITVLVNESVPEPIQRFQVGFLTWSARTEAYFLSLVEEYPPFRLEMPPAGGGSGMSA